MSDAPEKVNTPPSYSALTEGELLALTLEQETLTETAQAALASELRKRGLGEADIAAFQRDSGRRRSRRARWRRAQWLRLRVLLSVLVIWPGTILIPLCLAVGLVFILDPFLHNVLGLSQQQTNWCEEIVAVGAMLLCFAAEAVLIFSGGPNAPIRRLLRVRNRKPKSEEEKLRSHQRICPARNFGIALSLFLCSLYLLFLSLRDVEGWRFLRGQFSPVGWSYINTACAVFLIGICLYLVIRAPCVREKLWLAFAGTSYLLDLPKHLLHMQSAHDLTLRRDVSLLLWSAATIVALSFVKSAWQGPTTRNTRG